MSKLREIWKYPLGMEMTQVSMPKGAEILACQMQNGTPTLWVLADPEGEKEHRTFTVLCTGWPIAKAYPVKHVGTVQTPPYVWHVFEVLP